MLKILYFSLKSYKKGSDRALAHHIFQLASITYCYINWSNSSSRSVTVPGIIYKHFFDILIKKKGEMKRKRCKLTNKLKPVTLAKEVAIEAPDKLNSPRWPTNITEIICIQYCNRLTDIKGAASHSCLFTSSRISFLLIPLSWFLSS